MAPCGRLQNSRRTWAPASEKDRAGSTAVAQPGPRGGWHVSPRPRRGLSEGLGVTRKDPAEAGRIPAWRGCCQTTESTQAGLDRKALVKS